MGIQHRLTATRTSRFERTSSNSQARSSASSALSGPRRAEVYCATRSSSTARAKVSRASLWGAPVRRARAIAARTTPGRSTISTPSTVSR